MESFSVLLEADPNQLRDLRMRIARWLENQGINGSVSDGVVLAAHEATASAIESSSQVVSVEAKVEGRAITLVVTSDDGWVSPELDDGGQRMRIVRGLVSKVDFEAGPGRPRMRLEKNF